jgi:glycosyltransferase involved in cell wall biosynthesis
MVRARATVAVAVSDAVKRWLISEQPALSGSCVVVSNGVPRDFASNMLPRSEAQARLGLPPERLIVALVGRVYPRKGQLQLVEAAKHLKERGALSNITFLLVGEVAVGYEAYMSEITAAIAHAGLEDRFFLIPYIERVQEVWAAADIAVVPSLEPESFGLVAAEAMACGIPVVAAGHGGVLEIVENELTGLHVAPGDSAALGRAVERLAAD